MDLKTYCFNHDLTQEESERIGHAVGAFSRNFHAWAKKPDQEDLVDDMKGNLEMKVLKYQLNYTDLVATADSFPEILGEAKKTFEAVAQDVKVKIDGPEAQLIHGDFWSGK